MDHPRFERLVVRAAEIGTEESGSAVVKRGYQERVKAELDAYLATHGALKRADEAARKERGEGSRALEVIEQPYNQARSAIRLHAPTAAVPPSLKSLDTDTDKLNALRSVRATLDDYDDAPGWAKEIMQGPFGTSVDGTIREVAEAITATTSLDTAVKARSEAYAAAWDRFLLFRDLVRDSYGASSARFRRLHVRTGGKLAVEDPGDAEPAGENRPK